MQCKERESQEKPKKARKKAQTPKEIDRKSWGKEKNPHKEGQ